MGITGIGVDGAHVDLATATDEQLEESLTVVQAQLTANRNEAQGLVTLAACQGVLDGDPPETPELTKTKAILVLTADTQDGTYVQIDFDKAALSPDMKRWLQARVEEMVAADNAQIVNQGAAIIRLLGAKAIAKFPKIEAELP